MYKILSTILLIFCLSVSFGQDAFPYDLNLDDQLFKYGLRINSDLIQDNSAASYPVNVGNMGDQPQIKLLKWWFYPLLNVRHQR